jgi:predicted NBD/HSP70 family sugar kinase/biotin operon repressor
MTGEPAALPVPSPAAGLVFTTVLSHGPLSRVEVSRRTGLSSAAVTKAVAPLLADGYLIDLGVQEGLARPGRPASLIVVNPGRARFIGVKLTDSELIGVVTDLQARILLSEHRPLGSAGVADVTADLADLVAGLAARHRAPAAPVRHLGLTVSGDVDRQLGLVRYSPFLGWHDVALAQLTETATGLMTVVENDVRGLTIAEQWFGAGAGTGSFALVTTGQGIGCGLVLNGAVVTGAHGVAGEIGHLAIDAAAGPPCRCGGRGCVEAIASDPAIAGQVAAVTGRAGLTIADAIALAHGGDRGACAVFERAGHAIGLALASVANLTGPERIVISGEGLAAYDLFAGQLRRAFAAQAFGAAAQCEIIVRPLPFEEWARGAAAVAIARFIAPDKS